MILPRELRCYGSAVMADDDTTTSVGGAIDTSTIVDFVDLSTVDQFQVVSTDEADTAFVSILGRINTGQVITETVALTGKTPSPTSGTAGWERIMKVFKQASTAGIVAVERVTPEVTGTLRGVDGEFVQLALVSSSIDMVYAGLVLRITGGTGAGFIARVLYYNGTTKEAVIDVDPSVLDETSVYRLSRGTVLHKTPFEVLTMRRPFYNAIADIPNGAEREFYEKIFWRNNSVQTLTVASLQEVLNPTGKIEFAVEGTFGGTTTTANRRTAPTFSLSFDRIDADVPGGSFAPGLTLAVWLRFTVPAGYAATKSIYSLRLLGQTT